MNNIINQNEIRVIGLKRSGNHAIIHWILSQCNGLFLNNVTPNKNPFKVFRPSQGLELEIINKDRDWLIYSYEDRYLDELACPYFEDNHDKWLGQSRNRFNLLILRDPFNFFASRMKWEGEEDRITLDLNGAGSKNLSLLTFQPFSPSSIHLQNR